MPEEKLQYKTEAEKLAALEELQNKPGGVLPADIDEIERIGTAEVIEGEKPAEPHPAEDIVEEDITGQLETTETTETSTESTETSTETDEAKAKAEELARDFHITEELISQFDETFYDEKNKRNRKFITQKSPEDLLKSYVLAQKNNNYLKNERLPQEHRAGYERAKSEYEPQLAELRAQLEKIKAPDTAQAPAAPAVPAAQAPDTNSSAELNHVLEKLGSIDDGDMIEHTDELRKALILSQKVLQENERKYANYIEQVKKDSDAKFSEFRTTWQQQQDALNAKEEERQHQAALKNLYSEIDSFASSQKIPPEMKTNQTYEEMMGDALAFQNQLAEIYTGKTKREVDPAEWNKYMELSATAYLNNLPEMINKVKQAGVEEPKNYKKWVFFDQIDAIRTGWWRDPKTNQWAKRFDTISGKEIRLPDMQSAYNYYLDQTGQREKLAQQDKRNEINKVVNAINRRDSAVVQLDESKLVADGDGQALTEEDATKMIQQPNMDFITTEYRKGNPEPLNKLNAALVRLEQKPINPAVFV